MNKINSQNSLKTSKNKFEAKEKRGYQAKLNVNPFPKMPLIKNEILGEIREEIELEDRSRQVQIKKSKSTKIQSIPDISNPNSNSKWQLEFGITELEDLNMQMIEQMFSDRSESKSSTHKKVDLIIGKYLLQF
jgi:hypothetical protein